MPRRNCRNWAAVSRNFQPRLAFRRRDCGQLDHRMAVHEAHQLLVLELYFQIIPFPRPVMGRFYFSQYVPLIDGRSVEPR